MPSAQVAAICDANPRRPAEAMRSFSASTPPAPQPDFRRILERPNVDLIAVSVPPSQRMHIVEAAAQAGKNIVIQQPAAATLLEAFQLRDLGLRHSVSIQHLPEHLAWDREALTALLSARHIGTVMRVEIRDVLAASQSGVPAPLLDALEVASQVLSTSMPRRAVALTASGPMPA
jgi:predicted dehydrogenase